MATVQAEGIDGLRPCKAADWPTEWREVTQRDIDDFARLSGDDQWIPRRRREGQKESPFGTTIAHGNLTLSMIDGLRRDLISSTGFKLGVNYGWNRVRFPAPVPAGSRIRASAEVTELEDVGGGWWQVDPLHRRRGGLGQAGLRRGLGRPSPRIATSRR